MHLDVEEGVTLHVQVLGQGPPVVLLHGLLIGNMTTWFFTAAPELAKTHRVILFDLRGHGMSTRPRTGYDLETMSRDLEKVIDEVAGGRAMVMGHSYGAAVALTLAARARGREKVTRLAVVEAPLPASHLAELSAFTSVAPEEMLNALPPELRAVVTSGGRRARRFVDGVVALAKDTSLLADLGRAADVSDDALRALSQPVLAVYGTRSSIRNVGDRLARTIPGAELVTLEGGHFLPLEAPHALVPHLTRFAHG
jgi:pimeloyl-ACP methyl ester carboxylesterase